MKAQRVNRTAKPTVNRRISAPRKLYAELMPKLAEHHRAWHVANTEKVLERIKKGRWLKGKERRRAIRETERHLAQLRAKRGWKLRPAKEIGLEPDESKSGRAWVWLNTVYWRDYSYHAGLYNNRGAKVAEIQVVGKRPEIAEALVRALGPFENFRLRSSNQGLIRTAR